MKSLASYFGLQVSSTFPCIYLSFLLWTSAIQSITETGYEPWSLDSSAVTQSSLVAQTFFLHL